MSKRLLAFTAAALLPLSVQAADLPKAGTDSFTNTWLVTSANSIKAGDRTFGTYEIEGVARSDAGGPMFNNFGFRAVGSYETIGGEVRVLNDVGILTDKDGDQIFEAATSNGGGHGTLTFIGGTGKFVGITGTGEWTQYTATPIKADDKTVRGVVSAKASWKLP